ncbi:MAG TPA: hypothetical protein VEH27_13950 [Methylomirabilota bacterium]|nr:hypothetical protein [Methylomirabilota bacterium]
MDIVVVTTKPDTNEFEYGGRNPDGSWAFHGEKAQVQLADLTPGEQQTIGAARAILLAKATADAQAKGLTPQAI